MELWEYNTYLKACSEKHRQDTSFCILAGYYAAYYTNGGKKARNPNELIRGLYEKKQSIDEGLQAIERLKALDRQRETGHGQQNDNRPNTDN